jgi:hypothetical protein
MGEGSNPAPATNETPGDRGFLFLLFPIGLLALVGSNTRNTLSGVVVVKSSDDGPSSISTSGDIPAPVAAWINQLNAAL